MCRRLPCTLAAGWMALCMAGCGAERFPVAEVTGRVTLEGKPLEGVVVHFEPRNSDGRNLLPVAFGVTDSEGRYRAFRTGNRKFGAVVGVSQVHITVPEGSPETVHPRYGEDRAFWVEIDPGSNVIDLDLLDDPSASRLRVEEPAVE